MAMALDAVLWIAKMTWIALSGWISSCLTVADEFASSLRSGDIGPFHLECAGGSGLYIWVREKDVFVLRVWVSLIWGIARLLV
ncbi:hypothetical protein VNO80_03512 [Phaseolus coccineus]|uniref:Secreted protein n=1 Tax=Phaseolus coccineus TaxID=3886 RepID=A0AAN9NRT7_PHACN